MYKLRQLKLFSDFERMLILARPVVIYQQGELLDSEVIIKSHDEQTVTSIKNEHYMKSTCKFYYETKR